jgi:fatty-acid desaturase
MWTLVSGLGIACGYHRVFSHKTHKLPVWKENIILFFATFAGEGSSIFWTALHRGYHHPYADTERDLHSPVVYGSWHAYMGWLIKITETNVTVNVKYAVDLLRKPNHVWFHKHYLKILWGVPLLICFILSTISVAVSPLFATIIAFLSLLNNIVCNMNIADEMVLPTCLLAIKILNRLLTKLSSISF